MFKNGVKYVKILSAFGYQRLHTIIIFLNTNSRFDTYINVYICRSGTGNRTNPICINLLYLFSILDISTAQPNAKTYHM